MTSSAINMTSSAPPSYIQPSVVSSAAAAPVSRSPVIIRQAQSSVSKKRDTSGTKAIHNCDSCGKSFTTKFNLKRHINMHCHKSREQGVPIQGPPSASAPAKKPDSRLHKQFVPLNYQVGVRPQTHIPAGVPLVQTSVPGSPVVGQSTVVSRVPVQYQDLSNNNNNNNNSSERGGYTTPHQVYIREGEAVVEPDTTMSGVMSPDPGQMTEPGQRLPSVATLLPVPSCTVYRGQVSPPPHNPAPSG